MKDHIGNAIVSTLTAAVDALFVFWFTQDKNLAIVTFVICANVKRESLGLENKIGKKS
jgi:hypothetical protein